MGGKPKTPKPSAQELELQRNQRDDLNAETRDKNETLKALKRTLGGRRGLLGSGSELGIGIRSRGGGAGAGAGGGSGAGGGVRGGGGGGIMGSGSTAGTGGSGGRRSIPRAPRNGAAIA